MRTKQLIAAAVLYAAWSNVSLAECKVIPPPSNSIPEHMIRGADGERQLRTAFVVGNGSYTRLGALKNPVNDAKAATAVFGQLGFVVYQLIDGDREAIESCLLEMREGSMGADISSFYYAGHGVQIDNVNYIVPVAAQENDASPAVLVPIDPIVDALRAGSTSTLIFLDACRNNPFGQELPQGLSVSTARGAVPVGVDKELIEQELPTEGVFIAYSTAPNRTASDGEGMLSPFTESFVEHFAQPGVSVQESFADIARAVRDRTGFTQDPWQQSSLTVTLKLAGRHTLASARAASSALAADSLRSLELGERTQAIVNALKGLPVGEVDSEDFRDALSALDGALRSSVVRLALDGTATLALVTPDESRALLTRSDEGAAHLELWDSHSGERIERLVSLTGDQRLASALTPPAMSADGRRFAAISGPKEITVWDAEDGAPVSTLDLTGIAEQDLVFNGIALNADGTQATVTGFYDPLFVVWDVDQKGVRLVHPGALTVALQDYYREGGSPQVDFTGSFCSSHARYTGAYLDVLVGCGRQFVFRTSTSTLKISQLTQFRDNFGLGDTRSFSVTDAGDFFVIPGWRSDLSDYRVGLYRAGEDAPVAEIPNSSAYYAGIDPSGRYFAIAVPNNPKFFDIETGVEVKNPMGIVARKFFSSAQIFAKDGRQIASDSAAPARGLWRKLPLRGDELEDAAFRELDDIAAGEVERDRIEFWRH